LIFAQHSLQNKVLHVEIPRTATRLTEVSKL
jgi:hypothetical protein